MNNVVVYKSAYGYTKKYAEWIANELNCEILEASKVKVEQLKVFNTIIFLGSIYAGSINGFDLISKNYSQLSSKKVILCTVGIDSPSKDKQEMLDKLLTPEMKEAFKIYHLQGGMNYKELSFLHKMMMKMFIAVTKKKKNLSDSELNMINSMGEAIDYTAKDAIIPIVKYIQSN